MAAINSFLRDVSDPKEGMIVPARVSKALHMTNEQLAKLARLHRNTLRRPRSPDVQKRLGEIAQIIARAADLGGGVGHAIIWFRHQPLAGFDGETAAELVEQGHADAVMTHLEMLENGVFA